MVAALNAFYFILGFWVFFFLNIAKMNPNILYVLFSFSTAIHSVFRI